MSFNYYYHIVLQKDERLTRGMLPLWMSGVAGIGMKIALFGKRSNNFVMDEWYGRHWDEDCRSSSQCLPYHSSITNYSIGDNSTPYVNIKKLSVYLAVVCLITANGYAAHKRKNFKLLMMEEDICHAGSISY